MSLEHPRAATLAAYCRLFEELTPVRLAELRVLCTPDIRFVDPFNDIVGVDRYIALLEHMFRTVEAPGFTVLDQAVGARSGFVRWHFAGRFRGRAVTLDGVAEIAFDPPGTRIAAHIDHWDAAAQVYARLPVVGAGTRALRRLFAAGV